MKTLGKLCLQSLSQILVSGLEQSYVRDVLLLNLAKDHCIGDVMVCLLHCLLAV